MQEIRAAAERAVHGSASICEARAEGAAPKRVAVLSDSERQFQVGDQALIKLKHHDEPQEAQVIEVKDGKSLWAFLADDIEIECPNDDKDITEITQRASRDSNDTALRLKHAEFAAIQEASQERAISKPDAKLRPPQCPRCELPNPAEQPNSFRGGVLVEIGSGTANLSREIYIISKFGVGCYTVDWDASRNAHLCRDFRELMADAILKQFPNVLHFHVTWDCKANCLAGQQSPPVRIRVC